MAKPLVRHGWTLYQHPAFKVPFDSLVAQVQALAASSPDTYRQHPKAQLLKRVTDMVFDEIPQDPASVVYQQGQTLGKAHQHWKRAKFLQRFRLFFRFHSASRIIVYGWLNDENTLRKAGAKTDPYAVFIQRLQRGEPPTEWDDLLRDAEPMRPVDATEPPP